MTDYLLPCANISWQNNTPYAKDFNDIYWSREVGVQEKTHVFLTAGQLTKRWDQLHSRSYFTIAELGFGFGLNFLLTVDAWRKSGAQGILHFISFEQHPVSVTDLKRLKEFLPSTLVDELLDVYPQPFHGRHVIWFGDNIRLTLIFDNALTSMRALTAGVDAWYVDGFSPKNNESLWNKRVFGQLFRLSRQGATLTTYSVAGAVRRELSNAGFTIMRAPGFGRKREMLSATKTGNWQPASYPQKRVAILGKGVAGAFLNEALAKRNLSVTVIDDDDSTSKRVSQLAIYPSLAINAEHRYRFSLSAFAYTTRHNAYFHQSGLTIKPKDQRESDRWQRIVRQFPNTFVEETESGIYFPEAGWLASRQMTDEVASQQSTVNSVQRVGDTWQLRNQSEIVTTADIVIFATGARQAPISMPSLINIIPGLALSISLDSAVDQVHSGKTTIYPEHAGLHTVSGIYDKDLTTPSKKHVQTLLSNIHEEHKLVTSAVGLRAATRDRLPLCGMMPDWLTLEDQPGLYLLQGLGSHGGTTSRLCAEHIANLITGEPFALDRPMQRALAPIRFQLRDSSNTRTLITPSIS